MWWMQNYFRSVCEVSVDREKRPHEPTALLVAEWVSD